MEGGGTSNARRRKSTEILRATTARLSETRPGEKPILACEELGRFSELGTAAQLGQFCEEAVTGGLAIEELLAKPPPERDVAAIVEVLQN